MTPTRTVALVLVVVLALIATSCADDPASEVPTAPIGSEAALDDLEALLANWSANERVDVDVEISRQFPEPEADVDPIVVVEHRFRWDGNHDVAIGRTQLTAEPIVATIDYRIVDGTLWRASRPNAAPEWRSEPTPAALGDIAPFDARVVLQDMIDASTAVESVQRRANGGSVWDLVADGAALATVVLPPAEGAELVGTTPQVDVALRIEIDQFGQPLSARSDLDEWWSAAVLALDPDLEGQGVARMQINALFDAGGDPLDTEAPCPAAASSCSFEG